MANKLGDKSVRHNAHDGFPSADHVKKVGMSSFKSDVLGRKPEVSLPTAGPDKVGKSPKKR